MKEVKLNKKPWPLIYKTGTFFYTLILLGEGSASEVGLNT